MAILSQYTKGLMILNLGSGDYGSEFISVGGDIDNCHGTLSIAVYRTDTNALLKKKTYQFSELTSGQNVVRVASGAYADNGEGVCGIDVSTPNHNQGLRFVVEISGKISNFVLGSLADGSGAGFGKFDVTGQGPL